MIYLKETTVWDKAGYDQPNHVYILDGELLVGMIKSGEETPTYFKNPMKNFSKRYRTFKDVTKEFV